jgi:putative transposase
VALDEGRFGLKNWFHRRWCPKGIRPPWIVDDRYESFWLYAAVEPTTGSGHFLLLPDVTGECLELFLQHLRNEVGAETVGVVLDSSGSHRSEQFLWPAGMKPLYLPSYSPELNPVEQVFRHLRKRLSNTVFADLDALQAALVEELQKFWANPTILLHLTNYPWWVEGTQAILSLSP